MSRKVFDPIRRRDVAATPEELVRQALLRRMIDDLGYPKSLIAVEKELGAHRRRFDIVCYGCDIELFPLLIIECKAIDCSHAAREQAFGYNATFGALFICIVGKAQIHTMWLNAGRIESVPFLPHYRELLVHSLCVVKK